MSINSGQRDAQPDRVPLMEGVSQTAYIAGTIDSIERERLRRQLYRVTRGNAIVYFEQAPQNPNGKGKEKCVYIITFTDGRQIRQKITNICDSFSGRRIDLPELHQIAHRIRENKTMIRDAVALYKDSRVRLQEYLAQINTIENQPNVSTMEVFRFFVAREKSLYMAMNNMKLSHSSYIGYFWCPASDEPKLMQALQNFQRPQRYTDHSIIPPTYI